MTEQEFWDKAALAMLPACLTAYSKDGTYPQFETVAQAAAKYADAFMAERARRVNVPEHVDFDIVMEWLPPETAPHSGVKIVGRFLTSCGPEVACYYDNMWHGYINNYTPNCLLGWYPIPE